MVSSNTLGYYGRVYVWTVIAAGFAVVTASLFRVTHDPAVWPQWFILAALTLVSGSATVKLPGIYASITISEIFVFTAVLLYGPDAGTLIVALDGLVISFWLARRHGHREVARVLFNMSAPAMSLWIAARLFFWLADIPPLVDQGAPLNAILVPLIAFAVAYFVLNSWTIALVLSLERKISPFAVWPGSFVWLSLNYFCGASVAVLLVVYNRRVDLTYVGLIIPLLLLIYYTFKTSWGRVDDANRHLSELNSLYLSTIETLAMAIDAKDQITHGHIRRVQGYAIGLARKVGVVDPALIKAIEAAALLHDMGKLAVPEYILNKPGKLTAAEYDKMKLHASVGADILSSINFPYPVVPIVRHHHENWDGTGYPTGLRGTEIPMGARILSVVDCFDALTSDRPYRPRLPDDEALQILRQRRGSMYDPLIVDTFIATYRELAPKLSESGPPHDVLNEITGANQLASTSTSNSRLEDIAASADEMLTLYELARALAGQASIGDIGDAIAKHLRRLIPSSLCVFYLYNRDADDLEAKHAVGEAMSVVKGLRIPLGQRLSGWVAANRQTVTNSDPMLDFGDVARSVTPRLRNCLSTPLVEEDELVGVLTVYSSTPDGFSDDHRRVIEAVAPQIAHTLKAAADFDNGARRDYLTGLPTAKQFDILCSAGRNGQLSNVSVLLVDIINLGGVNKDYGRPAGDEVVRQVARRISAALRVADFLFRHVDDEFLVLLNETDRHTALSIANRITEMVCSEPVRVSPHGPSVEAQVSIACTSAPHDGLSAKELLRVATAQRPPTRGHDRPSIH